MGGEPQVQRVVLCVSVARRKNRIEPLATLFGHAIPVCLPVSHSLVRPSVVSILIPLSREFVFVAPLLEQREGESFTTPRRRRSRSRSRPPRAEVK